MAVTNEACGARSSTRTAWSGKATRSPYRSRPCTMSRSSPLVRKALTSRSTVEPFIAALARWRRPTPRPSIGTATVPSNLGAMGTRWWCRGAATRNTGWMRPARPRSRVRNQAGVSCAYPRTTPTIGPSSTFAASERGSRPMSGSGLRNRLGPRARTARAFISGMRLRSGSCPWACWW